nr:PIN domain-containing protein [Streptomyces sp. CS227]
MNRAVRDCLVTGFEPLIEGLKLPDEDDRHVLAAAIRAGAQVIVTNNRKDFPTDYLDTWGIERKSADEFVRPGPRRPGRPRRLRLRPGDRHLPASPTADVRRRPGTAGEVGADQVGDGPAPRTGDRGLGHLRPAPEGTRVRPSSAKSWTRA